MGKVKCIPVNAILCKLLYCNFYVKNTETLEINDGIHLWKTLHLIAKCHIELDFKFICSSILPDD